MKISAKAKPNRSVIDLSDKSVARAWAKKLGKSPKQISDAVAKVGNNAETIKRELASTGK
jgi:hypothetical protein